MSRTLEIVRDLVSAAQIRISEHGRRELANYGISLRDVLDHLATAVVVEDYPDYAKGPAVLCLQEDAAGRPVHVLWGVAKKAPHIATIITGYRPDPARWSTDWMTRKPR